MKKSNDMLYEAIKTSMVDDLKLVYEVFESDNIENLEGVIVYLNSLREFGNYLKNDHVKLAEFIEHLMYNVDFHVHVAFGEKGDDEFFPLIRNEK